MKLLVSLVILLTGVCGEISLPYIKPCPVRSSEFSKCAVEHGNAAIPFLINGDRKLGIPNLNPLIVPLVELSTGGFKLNGTDVKVKGIKNVYMNDMKVDEEKQTVFINLTNPLIELEFNYNIGGKLINIDVEGQGTGNISIVDCIYIYTFDFQLKEEGGKHYARMVKDDLLMQPKNFHVHFNNLFNGNKLIGDNINKFANENWQEILGELRPAIAEVVGSVIRRALQNIFKLVSVEEIFADYS